MKKKPLSNSESFDFRLVNQALNFVFGNSEFYKALFKDVDVESVSSLRDFQKLPFVSKADLTAYPKKFWCAQPSAIRDYCSTSGSEGNPMTIPLTEKDLARLAENEAESFATAGLNKTDVIQLCTTVDRRFMAGLAYILGARRLGIPLIRTGSGLPEYQWRSILDLKPTTLIIVPSFLYKLLAFAEKNGIDPTKTSLKRAICIGETIRNPDFTLNALGTRITEKCNLIELHSTYASSEMQTAFTECVQRQGGHYNQKLIYPEIIDENGTVLPAGQSGELVITTLGVEGFPLIRYKTGDITCLHTKYCSCGNESMRMGPITGRKNQMIKVKGTSCYPSALTEILNSISEIEHFQIQVIHDRLGNDAVHIYLSCSSGIPDGILEDKFRSQVRFAPQIIRTNSAELLEMIYPENKRKPLLFLDLRAKN